MNENGGVLLNEATYPGELEEGVGRCNYLQMIKIFSDPLTKLVNSRILIKVSRNFVVLRNRNSAKRKWSAELLE